MNELTMEYQIEKGGLEDPAVMVLEALNKNLNTRRLLEVLAVDWPDARKSIDTLCRFVSQSIRDGEEPVLTRIIANSLRQYQRVVWHKHSRKYHDPVRVATFMDALISEASAALQIEVRAANGDMWSVHSKCSFSQWLERHRGELTVVPGEDLDRREMRKGLYELITEDNIKMVLRRANYEAAIMAGSMPAAD